MEKAVVLQDGHRDSCQFFRKNRHDHLSLGYLAFFKLDKDSELFWLHSQGKDPICELLRYEVGGGVTCLFLFNQIFKLFKAEGGFGNHQIDWPLGPD